MKNIWLIFSREYYTRVTKRSFILGTILTPVGIGLLVVVSVMLATHTGGDILKIAVKDESSTLQAHLEDSKSFDFTFEQKDVQTLKDSVISGQYDGLLVFPALDSVRTPALTAFYYSDKQLGLELSESLKSKLTGSLRKYKTIALEVDPQTIKALETDIAIDPEPVTSDGKDASEITDAIGAGMGSAMGFIMYMVVFIYGMMVMRSVMEEKTNRIVEVIMSSVKPMQLMMGKILGIGALALTQLAIWITLIPLILFITTLVMGNGDVEMTDMAGSTEMMESMMNSQSGKITTIIQEIKTMNWWLIIPLFIFYFLGGFFLYSSLFAAVGSAIGDDFGESQSLTLPISIPVIIAFYIMMSVIRDPNTNLAVWSSIFPLFSPIVMPARLAFDPPMWQIGLSIVSLILGVWFFIWISARIYRVGILLYGKKVTLKELGKWMFSGN